MKIVVGLGNCEAKYAHTHHNMGFLVVECLAARLGIKFKTRECDSLTARTYIKGEPVILAEPQTYMNLSGIAVKQLLAKYKCESKDLIVAYDDIDLPRYALRVRAKGSAGTHNGMRSIIDKIATEDFPRVRVGIGRPPLGVPLADFVLSEVPLKDREQMVATIESAADEITKLICLP
ncbi:MAG: aminoacyl-tRNA hydrolase [Clostridiales bacterium]|nr:aminoacyl-tRNA hydrolase [Clostridiales bacterium]